MKEQNPVSNNNEDIEDESVRILIDTITKPADVRSVLEKAKKELGADDARFRLRSWDDRSVVVYTPEWIIGRELRETETELAERVYHDPKNPSRIDGLVGLVARVARIEEEEMKKEKNEDLIKELKENIGKNRDISKLKAVFNEMKDEPEFKDLTTKLDKDISEVQKKKERWEEYYDRLKKTYDRIGENQDTSIFFEEAFREKDKPWKQEENTDEKQRQWEELKEYLEEKKRVDEFKEFLKAVEKTVDRYRYLYEQLMEYKSYFENRRREIVVPVTAFGKFIGILNFHLEDSTGDNEESAKKKEFTDEDGELAKIYAARLAATYLQWQAELFEEFQKVAQTVTAEDKFETIASRITEGIREGLKRGLKKDQVFPLLYVPKQPIDESHQLLNKEFEEKNKEEFEKEWKSMWKDSYQEKDKPEDGSEIELWKKEMELGQIYIRTHGLGRTIMDKWASKMKTKKPLETRDQFIVCPDVDNPNSACGSRSAYYNNMKTTCCLPLTFNNKIYGLLYIHCEIRHFFTEAEFRALNAFGTQAAIAIKNAKLTGDSYEKLYGSELLDFLIQSARVKCFGEIGEILGRWADQVQRTRGNVIADITVETMKELSKYFGLPKKFTDFMDEFRKREGAFQSITNYREHFVHLFHVFCLGYVILCQWKAKGKGLGLLESDKDENFVLKTWFVMSIYHDVGVLEEKSEMFIEEFFRICVGRKIKSQSDWGSVLLVGENLDHIKELSELYAKKAGKEEYGKAKDFEKWFLKQLLEDHDHGVLTALILLNKKEEWENVKGWDIAKEAALAISLHNWKRNPDKSQDFDLDPLAVEDFPFAFFLTYCDTAQEWGRKVMLELMKEEIQEVLSAATQLDTILEEVEVSDNKTIVTINYFPKNNEIKGDITLENIFKRIGTEFRSTWYLKEKEETMKLVIKGRLFSFDSIKASTSVPK